MTFQSLPVFRTRNFLKAALKADLSRKNIREATSYVSLNHHKGDIHDSSGIFVKKILHWRNFNLLYIIDTENRYITIVDLKEDSFPTPPFKRDKFFRTIIERTVIGLLIQKAREWFDDNFPGLVKSEICSHREPIDHFISDSAHKHWVITDELATEWQGFSSNTGTSAVWLSGFYGTGKTGAAFMVLNKLMKNSSNQQTSNIVLCDGASSARLENAHLINSIVDKTEFDFQNFTNEKIQKDQNKPISLASENTVSNMRYSRRIANQKFELDFLKQISHHLATSKSVAKQRAFFTGLDINVLDLKSLKDISQSIYLISNLEDAVFLDNSTKAYLDKEAFSSIDRESNLAKFEEQSRVAYKSWLRSLDILSEIKDESLNLEGNWYEYS